MRNVVWIRKQFHVDHYTKERAGARENLIYAAPKSTPHQGAFWSKVKCDSNHDNPRSGSKISLA
jgi:hypothetical protein